MRFRNRTVIGSVLVGLIGGIAISAEPAPSPTPTKATTPAAPAKGPVEASAMQGVSFEGLTEAQKKLAVDILNDNSCDCSCGMKVAVCRRDDSKCGRSLALASQVIDLVKKGKSRDEIVKTALTPPSKFVQFPLTAGDSPSVGPKNAKVTVLHYIDYQCPFCSRAMPTMEQIAKDYPNDVRIVFKMHALEMHPNAGIAAEAAMAANAQGKFLPMHKKIFENQSSLSRDKLIGFAQEIGLDVARFTKDLDANAYKDRITKESQEVEAIGASGTPASFINGRYVSGAKAYSYFKDIIDEELKWARDGKRPEFKVGKNVSEASAQQPGASQGPDPNKVYDIPVGKAAIVGSPKAKVTLLHYLDYQ